MTSVPFNKYIIYLLFKRKTPKEIWKDLKDKEFYCSEDYICDLKSKLIQQGPPSITDFLSEKCTTLPKGWRNKFGIGKIEKFLKDSRCETIFHHTEIKKISQTLLMKEYPIIEIVVFVNKKYPDLKDSFDLEFVKLYKHYFWNSMIVEDWKSYIEDLKIESQTVYNKALFSAKEDLFLDLGLEGFLNIPKEKILEEAIMIAFLKFRVNKNNTREAKLYGDLLVALVSTAKDEVGEPQKDLKDVLQDAIKLVRTEK